MSFIFADRTNVFVDLLSQSRKTSLREDLILQLSSKILISQIIPYIRKNSTFSSRENLFLPLKYIIQNELPKDE